MTKELFLEIGTEEIPAGFIPKALKDMEGLIRKELANARIELGEIKTFATPRRLAIAVADLSEQQPDVRIKAMGPAKKVAFDADGNPTRAGEGFARGQGVDVSDLKIVETDKGEYVSVEKEEKGKPTRELLPEILPRLIGNISFKKSMRWKDLDVRFARPMHWIVALFNGEVVPFTFGNLESGNLSRGHRFMAPETMIIQNAENYEDQCDRHYVTADPEKRKSAIGKGIAEAATSVGGSLNEDEGLLEEVTYLVEDPTPLVGTFEEEYLQLPRELLITSMREHQRYFTVVDKNGNLMPHFITVSNTRVDDPAVVVKGNERVIRARLADAMFFWTEDQKVSLESRLEALKSVVYQKKLGTSYEKVMRFKELAVGLAKQLDPSVKAETERAALLSKCDLETGMVYEFPELQGIMGREYAKIDGEDPRVAVAIHEHYLPIEAGGELPSDNIGAFVSIADKIDSICGCFGVGLIPTGSADPFALRRSAIGILNIILDRKFNISIPGLVDDALAQLKDKLTRPVEEVRAEVIEFIRLRFVNMLTSQDYPADLVDAVLSASFDDPNDATERIRALAKLKEQGEFEYLAATFKRVANIIKGGVNQPVDKQLFEGPYEDALYSAFLQVGDKIEKFRHQGDYVSALQTIVPLRDYVDAFFEGVMVMADDENIKNNRLALLTAIARLFEDIADFTRIAD
ncbi:MAG: glycine--tRNA ligase subunit beta [Desulfuromonas sp.]|nr:MAG: glycine--tRNA ligase subunit beta [Desulfuromonas sp.]